MKNSNRKKAAFHIYSRSGNRYVYDGSTNMIFPDIDGFSEIVDNYYTDNKEQIVSKGEGKNGREKISRNYDYIDALIKNFDAFYFNDEITGNRIIETEEEFFKYLSNISQIVLEVTQSCNLRCSYCLYSGKHRDFRTHNKMQMDEEIAIKSIDRYFSLINSEQRTRKYDRVFVNFYGGEPLLNINLIKKVVRHVNNKILQEMEIGDKVYFTVSTNGTLLKDDILNFLIEKDFLLAVSLDGPKEEHDRNRLTISGKGSFDLVWDNISRMIESHKDYFKSHVVFLITLNPNHDPVNIDHFFKKSLNDGYGRLKISFLRGGNFSKQNKYFMNLRKKYFDGNSWDIDCNFSPFIDSLYRPLFKKGCDRKFLGRAGRLTSSCFPDEFRLFVSSTGDYHICERINPNFSIGNYKTGIRFAKVKKIFEEYNEQLIKNNCTHCIAKNFCSICFASVSDGKEFRIDRAICEEQIRLMKGTLRDVITLCEKNREKLDSFINPNLKRKGNDILSEAFY